MATPRYKLVDHQQPHFYHVVSRCVRQSFLCGWNKHTKKDYTHRKQWFVDRLHQLGQAFSVDIFSYSVMNNHFHLVVHYDPVVSKLWRPEEVVRRWLIATPIRGQNGKIDLKRTKLLQTELLQDSERIERIREKLSCLSTFMKMLKQPIARRANKEDKCCGHFFEQRFYSAVLLDEEAVLAAMAYVDMNPIRAKIASTLENCHHTSIAARLKTPSDQLKLRARITPIITGIRKDSRVNISFGGYIARLRSLTAAEEKKETRQSRWHCQIVLLRKRQRAYGAEKVLKKWLSLRGMQFREKPMIG